MSKIINKLWGHEEWIENNEQYCMKVLTILPGFQSSLHYHPQKDETFLVVSGCCDLELLGETQRLVKGEARRVAPGVPHRFRAVNDVCVVVEASTHHNELDVVRIEDSRRIE